MPWPYPAVNIGDINNLDAVFAPGLHLLETSGEDVVSAFINRHIVMPRLNVVDFVCNRIDPAVFITTTIFPDSLPESMDISFRSMSTSLEATSENLSRSPLMCLLGMSWYSSSASTEVDVVVVQYCVSMGYRISTR